MTDSTIHTIASEFDKNFSELKYLVQTDKLTVERKLKPLKGPECHEAVLKLHEAMSRVDREIRALRANINNNISASALESKLYEILARKNRSDNHLPNQPSTPLKSAVEPVSRTPEEVKKMEVDFIEYPSTPTLDQIGLSGKAMALVGRGAEAFSNSVSDSEYENSFFQKSPGIFKSTANDSFSSIGSIPNFHTLISSPSPQMPAGPHNLAQVTCAYDSGTDENSFSAINSSFVAVDELGKPKNNVSADLKQ